MNHALKITVGRKLRNQGVITCRSVTVREKLLRFLLGSPVRLTVIVPGNTVDEIEITEKGGISREQSKTTT